MRSIFCCIVVCILYFSVFFSAHAISDDFELQYFVQENKFIQTHQGSVEKINTLFQKLVMSQDIGFFVKLDHRLQNINLDTVSDNKKELLEYLREYNQLLIQSVDSKTNLSQSFKNIQLATQWNKQIPQHFKKTLSCKDYGFISYQEKQSFFTGVEGNYYHKNHEIYYLEEKYVLFSGKNKKELCYNPIILEQSNAENFSILYGSNKNLYGTFIASNNLIYASGKILEGADIASFQILSYAISKDKNSVYVHHLKKEQFDAKTFSHVFSKFFRDKNGIYIHHKTLHTFISENHESFEYLGGYFAKDASYVYNLSPTYGIKIAADADTFEYMGGWFGRDANNYYYRRWAIPGIDYDSAQYLGSYYIKDKSQVFCGDIVLEDADVATFQYLSKNLAHDKYHIYDNCKVVEEYDGYKFHNNERHSHVHNHGKQSQENLENNEIIADYCKQDEYFPDLSQSDGEKLNSNNSHYTIRSHLDYDNKTLSSSQSVDYLNKTGEDLEEIIFILDKNRVPNIFCLGSLRYSNGVDIHTFEYNKDVLKIQLNSPLKTGESISIFMEYKIDIPEDSYDFGTLNHKQLRFADWYPMIPPYIPGEGFIVNDPAKYGEYMAYDKADYSVIFSYDAQQSLVIAAPALEQRLGDTISAFELKNGRNFTWLVSPYFHKLEKTVGDTLLQSFSFVHHTSESQALLDASAESYELYSEIFHRLDQKVISIVEVDFIEAMEYQNIIAYGSAYYDHYNGSNKNLFIPIAVHEIAHQWWYGLVGNDQAKTPWLDEGFTMWSEGYYFENKYPDDYEFWKDFRMNRRNSQVSSSGDISSSIYDFISYGDYISSTYHKGVYYLEGIRYVLGDEKYFKLLKEYINGVKNKLADEDYFHELIEKYSQ